MDKPSRDPSVQILNPEDNSDRESRASDQASNRGRPVVEAAKDWLQSWQQIGAERQHQINQFLLKEAHRGLSNQEKLSIERETEKLHAVEEELQQFIAKRP